MNSIAGANFDLIIDYLRAGKVAVLPTDTIYGLSCLAAAKKAIAKIYQIKQRKEKQPLLVLVSSLRMLEKYAFVSAQQKQYLRALWPWAFSAFASSAKKPTTVILAGRKNLPNNINAENDSLAFRLPNSEFLLNIIKKCKAPLVSTSLNISGQENISDLRDLHKIFSRHKPDFAVDAGILKKAKPSRLIDLRDLKNIKIIRK